MWETIFPIIMQMLSKNNPNAANKINTAVQIMKSFDKDEKKGNDN